MNLPPPKPDIRMLGLPFRWLPDPIINNPLTQAINPLFRVPIEEGDFDFLENRCLKIHISDIDVCFYIGFDGKQLVVTGTRHHDVKFSGSSKAFLSLASRREDPDTLFFQRSLMIEGDTELGLGVKNLLDSIDLEQMPGLIQKLAKIGKTLQDKLPAFAH